MVRLRRRPSRRASSELDGLVLAQFVGAINRPLSAYDLCERIGREGNPIAPAQVYRTLNRLVERGAVHRVESLSAYVRSVHAIDIVSICADCHRVTLDAAPEISDLVRGTAAANGFEVHHSVVEVFGHCTICRSEEAKSDNGPDEGRPSPPTDQV